MLAAYQMFARFTISGFAANADLDPALART